MPSDYPTVLLAGRDPDLLLLRSAMLASAGMWSVRVRNIAQANQVLDFVDCDLAILCYTLDQRDRQALTNFLLTRHKAMKVVQVASGDDCSGSGFLRKVEAVLRAPAFVSPLTVELGRRNSRMIR